MPFEMYEELDFISTHSLTRRLTRGRPGSSPDMNISTHSLTRRLTTIESCIAIYISFQLTASQGG